MPGFSRAGFPIAVVVLALTSCAELGTGPVSEADRDPPVPSLLTAVQVTEISVEGGRSYRVESGFAPGVRRFTDAAATVAAGVPAELVGHRYIRTADADRNAAAGSISFLAFEIDRDAIVFVAHDNRLSQPEWLTGFDDTQIDIRDSAGARLRLFKREFARGRVTLGSNVLRVANKSTMYTVILVPAQPAVPPAPEPEDPSPHVVDECARPGPGWIWCDDFEQDRLDRYFEFSTAGGRFARVEGVGGKGSFGMRARWNAGQVSAGSLKIAFGRTPSSYMRPVDAGTADYREIYWRMYVRNPPDWVGDGADKLSRATVLAGSDWSQAMIAHVWSGGSGNRFLVIDPASGTDVSGTLVTTRYNDFAHLRWLGARAGTTPIFSGENLGQWHCVEAHVRLNDAGAANGSFHMWINGAMEAERTGINWLGSYASYGINAVFFENYWNRGSPVEQERYFDNLVVSTQRIGC